MKNLTIGAFLLFLTLCSCNSNSNSQEQEIARLKKANAELKEKLDSYQNAIVITRDNINKYVGAIAFGPEKVETNEKSEIFTSLYLHDLPVEVEWSTDQENQAEKESGQIVRYIQNSFPGAGKRTFSGKYTVKFPIQVPEKELSLESTR